MAVSRGMKLSLCLLFVVVLVGSLLAFYISLTIPHALEWRAGRNLEDKQEAAAPVVAFKHHDNHELATLLQSFADYAPNITRLYSIGKSVRSNEMWVLEISDNPGQHEPGEMEIKLVANIHGNEVVGRELLLHLIDYLLTNYERNSTIRALLDNVRLHILASANPDGYESAMMGACAADLQGRANANGEDLNRDFPDRLQRKVNEQHQPETMNMMKWTQQHPFVLSTVFHGGALVVNYPYDNNANHSHDYTASPDDDYFRYIALLYAQNNLEMKSNTTCFDKCMDFDDMWQFNNSITNGAEWYPVAGGSQDWNYEDNDCFEVTIELGCLKYPQAEQLQKYWNDNKPALMNFIEAAYVGVNGFVVDPTGRPIEGASIIIEGISKVMRSRQDGDYWRPLAPTRAYNITVVKDGYRSSSSQFDLVSNPRTWLNFTLIPENE